MAEVTETELETLRRTNAELVAKNAKRKARIAELEASNADAQSKLTEATASLHRLTVETPLRQMCESLGADPDLFQEQLTKHFKVQSVDGILTLLTQDGKPVTDVDGKSVPFERDALRKFLTQGESARAKGFRLITLGTKASGGGRDRRNRAAFAFWSTSAIWPWRQAQLVLGCICPVGHL